MPQDLKAILELTLSWEKRLCDFYDVAHLALNDQESRRIVLLLQEKVKANIQVLKDIDIRKYGKTEWIKQLPGYKADDLLDIQDIKRNSSAKVILQQILGFEKKLQNFYAQLADRVVSEDLKDLFQSLSRLKENQQKQFKRFMDDMDLAM